MDELQAMAAAAEHDNNILLKNLVPLNALSDEHLGQLISRVQMERLRPGQLLFREGDTDHQHVYLLEGSVALLAGDREVDTVQSGSNTARFALAHQWPRKFSARARSEVQVVRVDSHTLSELLVRTQTQSYKVSDLEADADGDWMSRVLHSRVFQHIPAANIQSVLRLMEPQEVSAGDVIIRQGEAGDFYYIIVQGMCSVTRFMDGEVTEVARLHPGDGFGEQALVSDGKRSSTVSMVSHGTLVRLPKEHFVELIKRPLVRTVKPGEAKSLVDKGTVWLDIRSPTEYAQTHLPEALNLPLEVLRHQLEELDPEHSYLVYGSDTAEGTIGAFLLCEQGLDAASLEGGTEQMPAKLMESINQQQAAREPDREDLVSPPPPTPEQAPETTAEQADESTTRRILELESQLGETHVRYRKALHQRVTEIRRLKQRVSALEDENSRLRQERDEAGGAPSESAPDDADRSRLEEENRRVRSRMEEMEAELEELQEVLQEASAEESTHQWERVRLESRLERLEASLAEQKEINRVLREENEETLRRLERLRS